MRNVFTCVVCTFDAVVRHKNIAMLSASGLIDTIMPCDSNPAFLMATQPCAALIASCSSTTPDPLPRRFESGLPQVLDEPVLLLGVCIHAAPPSSCARSWRGAAILHRLITLPSFLSLSKPCLRSIRVLGACSSSNRAFRRSLGNVGRRKLSLLHVSANRTSDSFA